MATARDAGFQNAPAISYFKHPMFLFHCQVVSTNIASFCQQPALENLKQKCLDVLDSKEHVKTLESLVTRYVYSKMQCVNNLSQLT